MSINSDTINKLAEMRLHGMVRAFQSTMDNGFQHQFSPDELLAHLVDVEWDDRQNKKQNRLVKAAGFRYRATLADIDFRQDRNLDKNLILRLSDCGWIRDRKDLIITGPTGVGKSFIGTALAHQACMQGFKVAYYASGRLFGELKEAKSDGSYFFQLTRLQKYDVVVLDDFGLSPFDQKKRLALLDLLEDRHARVSTMFISQLPVASWHDLIGDSTIADAIMDRTAYNSFRLELKGESMRKKMSENH